MPLQVTVTVPPAGTVAGLTLRALIVNVKALEVPPAGGGFTTVTVALPAAPMSLAGIAAVVCCLLTKVVVRAAPFHRTTAPETKLLPFTVKVNAGPPTAAALGESEL